MKSLIFAIAMTIIFTMFLLFQHDHNNHLREIEGLKYICDEATFQASLYYDLQEYSYGKLVFNRDEGRKAIENVLKSHLFLDEFLNPLPGAYWKGNVSYKVYFFDDSNTTFPYLYIDTDTGYTKQLGNPSIVVTVNVGSPNYRLAFINPNNNYRSSSHEWVER